MTFKNRQLVYLGVIAIALFAATTKIVNADTIKPQKNDAEMQNKIPAELHGNRYKN